MAAKAKKPQASFEQLLARLETTVRELEQGGLALDELLAKYSEGVELVRACQGLLEQADAVLQPAQEESI